MATSHPFELRIQISTHVRAGEIATLDDANVSRAKIVQLSDNDTAGESSDESFYDCDDGPEEVSLKFKQSVLKNRKSVALLDTKIVSLEHFRYHYNFMKC